MMEQLLEQFVKKSPVTVMARAVFEYAMSGIGSMSCFIGTQRSSTRAKPCSPRLNCWGWRSLDLGIRFVKLTNWTRRRLGSRSSRCTTSWPTRIVDIASVGAGHGRPTGSHHPQLEGRTARG